MKRCMIVLIVIFISSTAIIAQAPDIAWGVQFGTEATDFPLEVGSDTDGNVYVVGNTKGALDSVNAGGQDGFLIKFNAGGEQVWVHQFGTSRGDDVSGVIVDHDNNIIVAGQTSQKMGAEQFGSIDIFIAKLDAQGTILWLKQIGTNKADIPARLVVDEQNNIYATGKTAGVLGAENAGSNDIVVIKLDAQGNQQWLTQFGTSSGDEARDIAIDQGKNLFIVGTTTGSFDIPALGDKDAFIAKLDSNGTLTWVRQIGTSTTDDGRGVALDAFGNVYVGGWTGGLMGQTNRGGGDVFLTYFDKDGNRKWTQQFGTGNWEGVHGLAAFEDGSGDVLASGCWNWPSCHGWMRRYDNQGNLIWEKLIYNTASKSSCGQTVFVDKSANIYHIGGTDDNLFGTSFGDQDAFLVKLSNPTKVNKRSEQPETIQLLQNYPNPFNPNTEIQYILPVDSHIRLTITNCSGELVTTLLDARQSAGIQTTRWNARDASGMPVSSGLYIYQLTTDNTIERKKMLLIR